MCMITGNATISHTCIFAREAGAERQYLAYAMKMKTAVDVAMVLPLPIARNAGENALTFIDLSGYPLLFNDLFNAMGFMGFGAAPTPRGGASKDLVVHEVGSFEASFVPTIADFARLDERFRLPAGTWDKLPAYRDFGFAVFKFKAGEQKIHPMALSFPRADTSTLFFPTVHFHDGEVHEQADFDHQLYAQTGERHMLAAETWTESSSLAERKMDIKRAGGIIAGDQHIHYRQLKGKLPNQDTLLKFG